MTQPKTKKIISERAKKAYSKIPSVFWLCGTTLKEEVIRSIIKKVFLLIKVANEFDFTTSEYSGIGSDHSNWRGVEYFLSGGRLWDSCRGVNNVYLMHQAFVTDNTGHILNPMPPSVLHVGEIEDLLQEKNVFVNGISNHHAHMDSYMTVIDYGAFDKAFAEIKENYTKEEWLVATQVWEDSGLPIAKLLGKIVKRQFA